MGDPDGALPHLEQGRSRRSWPNRAGRALSDLALGAALLQTDGGATRAHRRLVMAADMFHALGDRRGLAATYNALGLAWWEAGDHGRAHRYWEMSAAAFDQQNDDLGMASAQLNQASARLAQYEPAAADAAAQRLSDDERLLLGIVEDLDRSLRLRTRAGRTDGAGMVLTHLRLGDTYMHLEELHRRLDRPAEEYAAKRREHWRTAKEKFDAPPPEGDPGGDRAPHRSSCPRIAQELNRRLADPA
jgi:hypothetical protein